MTSKEYFVWVEKYRPQKVADCILPEKIKNMFLSFLENKSFPNLLLSGTAGTGKTTVAKALCHELDYDYILINGSDQRNIDTVRFTIADFASTRSLSGSKKCILIDEMDSMTDLAQKALRATMEQFPDVVFIFTCNYRNKIIAPLQSRTSVIEFNIEKSDKINLQMQFIKRVFDILNTEKIEFDKAAVTQVVKLYFPDNRRILNELQKYAAIGKIDEGILTIRKTSNVEDLVKALKEKDLGECRKWVVNNIDTDVSILFRSIYDSLYTAVEAESVPELVILIGEYQYKSMFVADQEINFVALFCEILTSGGITFK